MSKKKNLLNVPETDYYATDPKALELLLELEEFSHNVWECACGGGHLCEVLKAHGHNVKASDLVNRGYPGTEVRSFFAFTEEDNDCRMDIITNPPAKTAKQFIQHALRISAEGTKIAMFMRLQFLEGQSRKDLFETTPPKKVYVSSSRLLCAKNGQFNTEEDSSVAYAWYIWEKGYDGPTTIDWFN